MSYLALARKYRPKIFADVMGQNHVVKALNHALDGDRLHPAILLTGTRGVGKTTLARIIAKGLNCQKGVSSLPCGVCNACISVDQGRFVDMIEIDAASNNSVDDVRQMIDNAQYSPAIGRYKVYLIDEVHMLSKSAFNALLKTLEEPPTHVKFILATTDPQKLPVTVLSRCLQFSLKRLPTSVLKAQIAKVLETENQPADNGAIAELARAADGSMRDALSLTDQAIAFAGGGALQREAVEDMLGTSGRRMLIAMIKAIIDSDKDALLNCMKTLETLAPDYSALINETAAQLQRLAMLQLLPKAQTDDDDPDLLALCGRASAEDVQLWYQIAVLGRRDLAWTPDPRVGFEMTLLRMLAFIPGGDSPEPRRAPVPTSSASAAKPVATAAAVPNRAAPRAQAGAELPRAVVREQPVPAPLAAVVRVAENASWLERIEASGLGGLTKQLLMNCCLEQLNDQRMRLTLDSKSKHLLSDNRRQEAEVVLSAQLGRSLELVIEIGVGSINTPAQELVQRGAAQQQRAVDAIAADPAIKAFAEHFDARVRQGSITPI